MKDGKLKKFLVSCYELLLEKKTIMELRTKYRLHIMSTRKTISAIKKYNYSIARFGDGEFGIMLGHGNPGFQEINDKLADELKAVCVNPNPNLLLCVPLFFNSTKGVKDSSKIYWKNWELWDKKQKTIASFLRNTCGKHYIYGNTQMTRPYMDYKNKRNAKKVFSWLKELWETKDILIVEGTQTRLGIGNDLFDNAQAVRRILCPAENAFDYYDEILNCVLRNWKSGELVLIALGPTATILAKDLSCHGIQALDVGHVDIEYMWFLEGAKEKTKIPGKYVNEASDGRHPEECKDETYLSQILVELH